MANCKNCIGNDYCFVKPQHPRMMEKHCKNFKNKADYAEVKHGVWVDNHCTVCGMAPLGEELWEHLTITPPKFELCMDYCPCCGAKMDGERKEEK